jgi:hypothetical protein
MMNQIHVIIPYRQASTWVFDDPSVGLKAEPFVSGIPDMVSVLVRGIPHAEQEFRFLFSAQPFPDYQTERGLLRSEYGEQWYEWDAEHMQGWLCSVLFKYFLKRLIVCTDERNRCDRPGKVPKAHRNAATGFLHRRPRGEIGSSARTRSSGSS